MIGWIRSINSHLLLFGNICGKYCLIYWGHWDINHVTVCWLLDWAGSGYCLFVWLTFGLQLCQVINVCPKLFFWGLRLKQSGHSVYLMKSDIHSDVSALNSWKPSRIEENKDIRIAQCWNNKHFQSWRVYCRPFTGFWQQFEVPVILYLVCLCLCSTVNQISLWNAGILKLMCNNVACVITNNTA